MNRRLVVVCFAAIVTGCGATSGSDSAGDSDANFEVALNTAEAIPTVVRVIWSTDLNTIDSAHVEFGPDTGYGYTRTADVTGEEPYETLLVGSKPNSTVHVRITAQTADGMFVSEDHTVATGSAPTTLPDISVETTEEDHWQGFLVTGFVASPPTAVIIDTDGEVVWWFEADDGSSPGPGGGGGIVLGRTALAHDGDSVLFIYNNVEGNEDNAITRVSLDGQIVETIETPNGHHDFVELDDGSIAYPAYEPRTVDGVQYEGDSVVERSADGTTTTVYSIWDYYEPESSPTPAQGMSWPHANAIDYVPELDSYLVSFLTLETIVMIDRETGEPRWTVGGAQSDFTLSGGVTELFDGEHQFEWLGDSILVFINGGMTAGGQSRAVEYTLDQDTGSAREAWSYWPSPSLNTTNLGDVDRLDSGHTLVTFSTSGVIHEVTEDDDVVWSLTSDLGGALSYATQLDSIDAWTD